MFYLAKKLYRPEFFQGNRRLGKPSRYFEGWYFKADFPAAPFAFIPGISLARDDPHGFIQVLAGVGGSSGEVQFSLTGIDIDLDGLKAHLQIENAVRWPSTLFSPSSMGWYSFTRFMECYHGIIALDADIEGTINAERQSGGRFYLEKDWGTSFPKAWIWMQSNSFSTRASFSCSVARVPFRGKEFTGFIIGLYSGGTLRTFTIQLASPIQGEMRGRIEETFGSEIYVELHQDGRRLFSDRGVHAGMEAVNPALLLQGIVSLRAE